MMTSQIKRAFVIGGILLVTALVGGLVFVFIVPKGRIDTEDTPLPPILVEDLTVPSIQSVTSVAGRSITAGTYEIPLESSQGTLLGRVAITVRMAHETAVGPATAWAPDAALVFVKSLGAVTEEGMSGGWHVVFASKEKQRGFEIVLHGSELASSKEIDSTTSGYPLPEGWYDSNEALRSLRGMPQFKEATISSLTLYYNPDGKRWGYGLSTSKGTVSMPI